MANPNNAPKTPAATADTATVAETVAETTAVEKAVEPPVVPTAFTAAPIDTPVVQAPEVVVKNTAVADSSPFEKLIADVKANGNQGEKTIVSAFERYLDVMAPGKIIEDHIGAGAQLSFFTTLRNALQLGDGNEFKSQWKLVLAYFNHYEKDETALGDRYIGRFGYAWSQDGELWDAYVGLVHLIKLTANPSTRTSALKQVSLKKVLERGFNDEAGRRLSSFYS